MPRGVGSAVHVLRRCLAVEGGGRERTVGQLRSICFFESQQGRERPYEVHRRCMENVEEERAPSRLSAIFAAAALPCYIKTPPWLSRDIAGKAR